MSKLEVFSPEWRAEKCLSAVASRMDWDVAIREQIASHVREAEQAAYARGKIDSSPECGLCPSTEAAYWYCGECVKNDVCKDAREKAFSAGFQKAIELAAALCDVDTTTKVCKDSDHDDRWCPTCSAMQDEAGRVASKVRAIKNETSS